MTQTDENLDGGIAAETPNLPGRTDERRTTCHICGYAIASQNSAGLTPVPCHVRAFVGETFHVWRCPTCRTIHCFEVVDLAHYYAKYPFADAEITWPFRIFYRNLARRLTRFGFAPRHRMLDYGCGNGLFVKYLRGRGFEHCVGYDPYGKPEGTGDPAILKQGPFDFILLQDVLEHVEDPDALLREMDSHLASGGHILVGTPNADSLDLTKTHEFLNELHAPYHLHIYTRSAVENMGKRLDWTPVGFFDRPYHDRPIFGLNTRAAKVYQRMLDGTMDAVLGPTNAFLPLTSPAFWFYGMFGYWLSYRSDMSIMFRKSG